LAHFSSLFLTLHPLASYFFLIKKIISYEKNKNKNKKS